MTTVSILRVLSCTNAFQTVYESTPGNGFETTLLHVANTDSGAHTIRLCVVAPSFPPSQTNALVWDLSVGANTYVELARHLILPPGYTLQARADASNVVNVVLSGNAT